MRPPRHPLHSLRNSASSAISEKRVLPESIQSRLLAYYDAAGRDLPWRRTRDPYAIWVSEIMCQQTRVETALPYYERWMTRFPSVEALATAEQGEVLKAWEGLGYYSRARNLHRAAMHVSEHHGGTLPDDPQAMRALPGFGEYTTGAVASIAYGKRLPAVDGNVRRVLSRLYDVPSPGPAQLRGLADALVPAERPGDFNQAIMELGARICTPRSPRCGVCPVAEHCRARAMGTQAERPGRKPAKPVPESEMATIVAIAGSAVLLTQRPQAGLLAGLWEFPGTEPEAGEPVQAAARRLCRDLLGGAPATCEPLVVVSHTFSHRRIVYHAFRCEVPGPPPEASTSARWIDLADLGSYALPVAQQKIQRAL